MRPLAMRSSTPLWNASTKNEGAVRRSIVADLPENLLGRTIAQRRLKIHGNDPSTSGRNVVSSHAVTPAFTT